MMKNKFILLLVAVGLIFGSCVYKKDYESGDQSEVVATAMHTAATGQMRLTLDPFNVAFRLNTLMDEAMRLGVDVNDPALATQRASLFGGATITPSLYSYTITYEGAQASKDYLRTGSITILTNGTTLSSGPGSEWGISLTKDMNYKLSMGSSMFGIYAESYQIIAGDADNVWKLIVKKCETELGPSQKGVWTGTFTVKQNDRLGDQSLSAVGASTYSVGMSADPVVSTLLSADTMSVSTARDISFHPTCPLGTIVGNGKMTMSLVKDPNPMAFTVSEWEGATLTDCAPKGSSKFYGNTVLPQ